MTAGRFGLSAPVPVAAIHPIGLRPRYPLAYVAILMVLLLATGTLPASAQAFNPIREKVVSSWNTNRNLVDIEIVGSTSMIQDLHRLEPERMLRFRLERAYLALFLAEKEPGFEIVDFAFDVETGLPESLFLASMQGPGHRDIPGVPALAQLERVQRDLHVAFQSDVPTAPLKRMSRTAAQCRGREVESTLFEYNPQGGEACLLPHSPPGTRRLIAPYDDDLSLVIICRDENAFPSVDCELQFPFHTFGATLRFHHDRLPKWRASVARAIDFLTSNEYR
jgi:hypothetical protein